ncbi:MAG: hypothetical protein MZW92_57260 [Comamonadaceae bacterium]|nr:hypothetical protein [Comamonadaceae bacterium]
MTASSAASITRFFMPPPIESMSCSLTGSRPTPPAAPLRLLRLVDADRAALGQRNLMAHVAVHRDEEDRKLLVAPAVGQEGDLLPDLAVVCDLPVAGDTEGVLVDLCRGGQGRRGA